MLIAGICAFAALLLLTAYVPDLEPDPGRPADATSVSATGFGGLVKLLRAQNIPVTLIRVPPETEGASRNGFHILTPQPRHGRALPLAAMAGGKSPTLVVLPKWKSVPDQEHPGWVFEAGLAGPATVTSLLPAGMTIRRANGTARPVLTGNDFRILAPSPLRPGSIRSFQTLDRTADLIPVLHDAEGRMVLARYNTSRRTPGKTFAPFSGLYILSDPDLLNTQGLKDLDTARVAMFIVSSIRDNAAVAFDVEDRRIDKSRELLRLLFEPPLLGATCCAVAAALLILVMALFRFGPPLRAARVFDFGKSALAANTAQLIAVAGREPRMALPYAQLVRSRVIAAIRPPAHLDQTAEDAYLDAVARAYGLSGTYTELAAQAAEVRNRASLRDSANRLHRWAIGMRRGHR